MTDNLLQAQGSINTSETQTAERDGEDWIQAILDQDFEQLIAICHQDVKSTMLLPKRIAQLDNAADLARQVEDWFGDYDFIEKEQSRVAMVGDKLAIFYRLRCKDNQRANTIEQQLYCSIRDGRIVQLRLICSGVQPDLALIANPMDNAVNDSPTHTQPAMLTTPQANELLEFKANAGQGSTCAMLTPYIRSKLRGLSSGQVLEVHVDDPTAEEDIEAWCRLSGNILLKMEQIAEQELVFYIQKK